jgi:hypothetical protein
MVDWGEPAVDAAGLVVPLAGRLVASGDRWEPYRLLDGDGVCVAAARVFFGHLQAAGRSEATVRSHGLDQLRWFRFVWAAGVAWDQVTWAEAREFCRWLVVAGKPARPHWRERRLGPEVAALVLGRAYAPSVRAHGETVLRSFYDFHGEAGTGPLVNPVPLGRSRRGGRAHAHHNPMEPYRRERSGLSRPVVPSGSRVTCRMRSSTRSSRRWAGTGTGCWWRSVCPRRRGPAGCCRRPGAGQIRGGS